MSSQPLRFVSLLATSRQKVWESVSTMPGVNYELAPLMRMTYPAAAGALDLEQAPLGVCAFHSYLLAFGFLPLDRHALTLVQVQRGMGFLEESSSLLQRRWRHERRLSDLPGGGCKVTDVLHFDPRLPFLHGLVARIVTALFSHRHRRLRQRFGGQPGAPDQPETPRAH